MPDTISIIQESVCIPGPSGSLEGVLAYPAKTAPEQTVLIVGPHPLLGGDFNNNVVHELATSLAMPDALTLRFNFRGVGCSDGKPIVSTDNIADFWAQSKIDGETELQDDVAACANWLRLADRPIDVVVGYSFGTWLASRWAIEQIDVDALILLAPTITQHDYSHLKQSTKRKLILSSHDDFAVPLPQLKQQFAEWMEPKQLQIETMDNHFFRGCENRLSDCIRTFIENSA